MWGSRERLITAIRNFLAMQQDRYPLPEVGEGEPDWERLRFSVHGIRGAAGNLALPGMAELAARLEAMAQRRALAEVQLHLPRLRQQLELVALALPPENAESMVGNSAQREVPDAGEVLSQLQALLAVLRRHELDDDLLNEVDRLLLAQGRHQEVVALRTALESFDFEAACTQVQAVIEQLPVAAGANGAGNEK